MDCQQRKRENRARREENFLKFSNLKRKNIESYCDIEKHLL